MRALEALKPEVPDDPERLRRIPDRMKEEQYSDPSGVICREGGKMQGYFEERLRKDMRYRLGAALAEAGKLDSNAGRAAMNQVAPRLENHVTHTTGHF